MPLSKKVDEKTDRDDQQPDILGPSEQKRLTISWVRLKKSKEIRTWHYLNGFLVMKCLSKCCNLYTISKELIFTKKRQKNLQKILFEDTVLGFVDRVKKMPEGVEKNEGKKILKIVSKILDFNLNEQKQRRWGLKILTSNQIFSRFPISLAQLKARKNSGIHKTEIRQLLYSFYRSKKPTKKIYKSLISIIWRWKQFLWTSKTVKQVNHTDLNWI